MKQMICDRIVTNSKQCKIIPEKAPKIESNVSAALQPAQKIVY